jgi:hypothetical protein
MARDPNRDASDPNRNHPGSRSPDGAKHGGEHADRDAERAHNGPTRPENAPDRAPRWTERGDMPSHNASAMAWVRASHEKRQEKAQQTEQALDKDHKKLSFFEDRKPHRPNYEILKREQAEQTLKFNEGRDPDQDRSRGR